MFLCLVFLMFLRLYIAALWSPAGKGLTPWLLLVMFIVFCNFPMCCPGSGMVLDCIISLIFAVFLTFQDQLSFNACQKYCRMLQGEHSAILSTFI